MRSWRISWSFQVRRERSFCRDLNCDVLGWCVPGGNNTLCLWSLLFLRCSKGFPDIISLFLMIIPWHTQRPWVKWFSHNPPAAESGPELRSPDLSLHPTAFKIVALPHGEGTIYHHRCKGLGQLLEPLGKKRSSLLSCSSLMKLIMYELILIWAWVIHPLEEWIRYI